MDDEGVRRGKGEGEMGRGGEEEKIPSCGGGL
jgi:hypothetical protein